MAHARYVKRDQLIPARRTTNAIKPAHRNDHSTEATMKPRKNTAKSPDVGALMLTVPMALSVKWASVYATAHSAERSAACSSTVCVAFSCLSGG